MFDYIISYCHNGNPFLADLSDIEYISFTILAIIFIDERGHYMCTRVFARERTTPGTKKIPSFVFDMFTPDNTSQFEEPSPETTHV